MYIGYIYKTTNILNNKQYIGLKKSLHGKGLGKSKSDEHKKKISEALKGKKKPLHVVEKINKNPEKIRKTAEKHLGMKRSEEAKNKMSLAKKGKPSPHKGNKWFYDPILEKNVFCKEENKKDYYINGIRRKQKKY